MKVFKEIRKEITKTYREINILETYADPVLLPCFFALPLQSANTVEAAGPDLRRSAERAPGELVLSGCMSTSPPRFSQMKITVSVYVSPNLRIFSAKIEISSSNHN